MWAKRGDEARALARLNCKRRATDRSPGKKKAPAGAVGQPDIPRFPPVELSCLLRFVPTPLPGSGLPLTLRPRGLTSHSPFLSFLPAHARKDTHTHRHRHRSHTLEGHSHSYTKVLDDGSGRHASNEVNLHNPSKRLSRRLSLGAILASLG